MIVENRGAFIVVPLTAAGGTTVPVGAVGLDLTAITANIRRQQRWTLKISATAAGSFSGRAGAWINDGTDWGFYGLNNGDVNGGFPMADSVARTWYFGFEDLGPWDRFAVVFGLVSGSPTWVVSIAPLIFVTL